MFSKNVPPCPFCKADWFHPGSSYLSSGFHQQGFTCSGCGCFVQFLSHQGGNLLAYITRDICEAEGEGEDATYRFPKRYTDWVDRYLLPTWRDWSEQWETHKETEWRSWLEEVFFVQFPELTKEGWPKHTISYHDCPPEAQEVYDDQFWEGDKTHSGHRKIGLYIPPPPTLKPSAYPPQAPRIEGLFLRFHVEGEWKDVDFDHSAMLLIPEDPILRRNREFFDEVWAAVEQDLPPRTETQNQYGGIEPWYTFELGGATFTCGWRKRVVSLQVEYDPGFPTACIKALAERDGVTYSCYGPLYTRHAEDLRVVLERVPEDELSPNTIDELIAKHHERFPEGETVRERGWQDRSTAYKLEIHAWGKDKTIEYLTALCRTILTEESKKTRDTSMISMYMKTYGGNN